MNIENAERLLLDCANTLKDCGAVPFLQCGTLLGAVREGRIMPHDNDVDLGVRFEEMKGRWGHLSEILTAKGYRVEVKQAPFAFDRMAKVYGDGCHADIIGLMLDGDVRFCMNSTGRYAVVMPAWMFEDSKSAQHGFKPPAAMTLGNVGVFFMPNPPEEYLELHYGPNWQTPDPEKVASECRVFGYRPGARVLERDLSGEHLDGTTGGDYYDYLRHPNYERTVIAEIARHVGKDESVLDVGCAFGLLGRRVPRYVGIDGSAKAIFDALQDYPPLDGQLLAARLERFHWECLGGFDTLVLSAILHCLIKRSQWIPFIESYRLAFGATKLIATDIQKADYAPLRERYRSVHRAEFDLGIEGLQRAKNLRFVEVFEL